MLTFRRSGFQSSHLAVACAVVVTLAAGSAAASDPFALYAVPTAVELLPNDADATRVVIHGSFLFLTVPGTSAVYGDPKCGAMYFQCTPGEEDLCRMQWRDLRNAVGGTYCAGFGTLNMLSAATLRQEGAPLIGPDKWEMGMGVAMASYLGGECPKALALKCAKPSLDGGAPDAPLGGSGGVNGSGGASGLGGAGGRGGASGSGGASGRGGAGGSSGSGGVNGSGGAGGAGDAGDAGGAGGRPAGSGGGVSTGGGATGGAPGTGGTSGPAADAAVGGHKRSPSGCSFGGSGSSRDGLLAAGIGLGGIAASRRRRARTSRSRS